ncbi:MAG: glycosyltransferase [Mycobacterium sp.]
MSEATRVAIVHERLTEPGGSEQVVEQLALEWPSAKVYVPIAEDSPEFEALRGRVSVTWVDKVHRATGRGLHAPLLPAFAWAFSHLRFDDPDVVIISHHSVAVAAVNATDAPTVAYVHSPARWAWETEMRRGEASGPAGRAALAGLAALTRRVESKAAPKITTVVANSNEVRDRIALRWNRDSVVVHPPVNTDFYTPDPTVEREDFFLLAGRLVPYKQPHTAIAAARSAGARLVVAGDGRMAEACRAIAGPETTFLGRISDDEMRSLQRRARALLMPGVEDFGIVPVEAMACGTPVIATGLGGALDTVVPGVTGRLVEPGGEAEVIAGFTSAIRDFDDGTYDSTVIRKHAEQFSREHFRAKMREIVDAAAAN